MKNVFGPVLKYQLPPNSVGAHNDNLQLSLRLQLLLRTQAFVEESAICQITPMIHIVSLYYGKYKKTQY